MTEVVDLKQTVKINPDKQVEAEVVSSSDDSFFQTQTVETSPTDPQLSKAIRKLDLSILPYCCLLYLICYIDRVNLGYAKVYNLLTDLDIPESSFGLVILAFYLCYCLFEIPSNLVLKKLTASRWFAFLMLGWGLVTLGNTFVQNLGQLVLCRCLVGVFEAGLFPGIVYYLSYFYPSSYLGLRLSWVVATSSLANATSGILAFGITRIQWSGFHTWQPLFLVEAFPPILLAIVTWFKLPDTPQTFGWLDRNEKETLDLELRESRVHSEDRNFNRNQLKSTLSDLKLYLYMSTYFCIAFPLISQTYLLPTIILQLDLNLDKTWSILLASPPFLLAFVVTLINGKLSDKYHDRGYSILIPLTLASIGYILQVTLVDPVAKYLAICLVNGFGTATVPILLTWTSNNFKGTTANALATSCVVTFGNLGGAFSGFLYQPYDAPHFSFSNSVCIGSLALAILLTITLKFGILPYQNRKLEERDLKDQLKGFRLTL